MSSVTFRPYEEISTCPPLMHSHVLSEGGTRLRQSPDLFYNNDGDSFAHHLRNNSEVQLSEIILASFDQSSYARGTAVIKFDRGQALFPKCASKAMTEAFLAYNQSVFEPENPDSNFYSFIDFNTLTFSPMPCRIISGDALWVTGDETFNWGIWLWQVLPTLWLAEKHQIDATILCYAGNSWQRKFLEKFAPSYIDRCEFQDLQAEYGASGRLRTIIRTERNMFLTDYEKHVFDQISAPFRRDSGAGGLKLFVSRRLQASSRPGYRVLKNETSLCELAESLGYAVIYPETMTFDEQFSAFANAVCVIGVGGAGMFNTLLCKPGTPVLTVEGSSNWLEAHANLFFSRGLKYSILLGEQCNPNSGNPHDDWYVNLDTARRAVTKFESLHGI